MEIDNNIQFFLCPLDVSIPSRRERECLAETHLLSQIFGREVRLEHHPDGSPYIVGYEGFISISHSRTTLLIALSDKPIGVDIENVSARVMRVREKFLTREKIEALGEDMRAVTIEWCKAEAYYKLSRKMLHPDASAHVHFRLVVDEPAQVAIIASL